MKLKIIFTILLTTVLVSCKTTEPSGDSNTEQPFNVIVQHWFANPDSDSNFTERGTDVTIYFPDSDFTMTPEYVIFNERKSFPPIITPTAENIFKVEARIILESALFHEASETVSQPNQLVVTNSDGEEVRMEIREWETLPARYD
tara:strand:+ start:5605 stop:6039 length:435 start_codon:yes stop_codon:yes gene_type:complete